MKFFPEVCLEPRNSRLDSGDDPYYDSDPDYDPNLTDLHETFIRGVSPAKDQSTKLRE